MVLKLTSTRNDTNNLIDFNDSVTHCKIKTQPETKMT